MEYSKEFKAAISNFSSVEKDRLIFRLLKKDKLLSKKLYFELIDPENTDQKRTQMEENIREKLMLLNKYLSNHKYYLMHIRKISSEITEHLKVTTDKYGEVSLNLFLVNEILENNDQLNNQRFDNVYKLYLYLINKIIKSFLLTKKLDEDYWMEIDEYLREIRQKITDNHYLKKLCENNGINLNWFATEKIPANIDQIVKDLKTQGFLR
ncbi:MAG: deoxyuridine 5'-triphosphate nucleotidohydrolase [Chryseobacterium sp.]|uniref:deoxyuridine 5'-triphosphate nucleotidohydrolase n=1 Tax=Chryseobacterium sp. TaxID=1871047 RepID=UPI000DB72EAE|nr:deoxyuridine 5'-triphosphate nucleotidohydrolase [Chryseobacterium sp.]MPS66419.1 deoxyuridine 5'-triphosphate nucleotidohydrolase [Chryseobacterium sp.]PZU02090.1 MAG: deoxyuridine 5'-triphosphate nucleotidohydrolase [Chryseobacterium sp.]